MKRYSFNFLNFTINVEVETNVLGQVMIPYYLVVKEKKMYFNTTMPESDFLDDMKILTKSTEGMEVNEIVYKNLIEIVQNHILKYGRISASDLYTYVGEVLLIVDSIAISKGFEKNTDDDNFVIFDSVLNNIVGIITK